MRNFPALWALIAASRLLCSCDAFVTLRRSSTGTVDATVLRLQITSLSDTVESSLRRACLSAGLGSMAALLGPQSSIAEESSMYSPTFVQEYEDFIKTKEGWSYRDVKVGKGESGVQPGDRVLYDWSGYTIGYFGRPFQAKG